MRPITFDNWITKHRTALPCDRNKKNLPSHPLAQDGRIVPLNLASGVNPNAL